MKNAWTIILLMIFTTLIRLNPTLTYALSDVRETGMVQRHGKYLKGDIGDVEVRWDRHKGGAMSIISKESGSLSDIQKISLKIRLASPKKISQNEHADYNLIDQEYDSDPRLIYLEEGIERIGMRVLYSLYDSLGCYHGDGIQETWIYRNGNIFLSFAVRLVNSENSSVVQDAWVELVLPSGSKKVCIGNGLMQTTPVVFNTREDLKKRFINIRKNEESGLRFCWFPYQGRFFYDRNDNGPWSTVSDAPPFYEYWGSRFDQWRVGEGWGQHKSGSVTVDKDGKLGFYWLRNADYSSKMEDGFRGILEFDFLDNSDGLKNKIKGYQVPLEPVSRGGRFSYFSIREGAYVFKKEGRGSLSIQFPPDVDEREVHIKVFNLKGYGGVKVLNGKEQLWPQLISDGGKTDDPNGPELARPDDRYGPIMTDSNCPASEMIVSCKLRRERETTILINEVEGSQLSYQKWDDRRNCLLFSSKQHERPIMELSFRDGKIRNIWISGSEKQGVAISPLYWFKVNASSPFYCFNDIQEIKMKAVGPESISFVLTGTNSGKSGVSEFLVNIPYSVSGWFMEVDATLMLEKSHKFDSLQYLNLFPERSRFPEKWAYTNALVMNSDGDIMKINPRNGGNKWYDGKLIDVFSIPLFCAYYSDAGIVLYVLVKECDTAGLKHRYDFCRVWTDSHFSTIIEQGYAGANRMSVKYAMGMIKDDELTELKIIDIGKKALKTGKLIYFSERKSHALDS